MVTKMKDNITPNGVALPEHYTTDKLKGYYDLCASEYTKAFRRAKKLDSTDRGKIWDVIDAKFPSYQILPDTNHVAYVKNNILASIYTVGKSARLIPTSSEDKDIVENLNIALDNIWATSEIYRYQLIAGERAALMNYGLTQVGWDNSLIRGSNKTFCKGEVVLKNINPLKFMRDPFADNLDTAAYCMTWDDYHKSVILDTEAYKEPFKEYLKFHRGNSVAESVVINDNDKLENGANKKDYYRIVVYWVNDEGKIHEIHTVNSEYVLYVKQNIKPSAFPFAELYCNLPAGDIIGTSEPAKIFANSLAYNLMNSILLTAEYKQQRPPRFVNNQSGINVANFVRHGNDADRTYVCNGDPSKAVSYHQFPQPSQQAAISMSQLGTDIQSISGIDGRYTGRDTGSILTTGGINSMLDQATMIDMPKVNNYEYYCTRLTKLVIMNYICHSTLKRTYVCKDKSNPSKYINREVDFPEIPDDIVLNYELSISSELPKNKARTESVAQHLMEIQMQYQGQGTDVDLITPEEYLMMSDIPYREYMQERMGVQRTNNWSAIVAQAVTEYNGMVENGVDPNVAMNQTAKTMSAMSQGNQEQALNNQAQEIQNQGQQF